MAVHWVDMLAVQKADSMAASTEQHSAVRWDKQKADRREQKSAEHWAELLESWKDLLWAELSGHRWVGRLAA